jgi:hypothetical protein
VRRWQYPPNTRRNAGSMAKSVTLPTTAPTRIDAMAAVCLASDVLGPTRLSLVPASRMGATSRGTARAVSLNSPQNFLADFCGANFGGDFTGGFLLAASSVGGCGTALSGCSHTDSGGKSKSQNRSDFQTREGYGRFRGGCPHGVPGGRISIHLLARRRRTVVACQAPPRAVPDAWRLSKRISNRGAQAFG